MAKLADKIKKKVKPIVVDGVEGLYVNDLTVKEVQQLQDDLKGIQAKLDGALLKKAENPDVDLTKEEEAALQDINGALVVYLFQNVIVGDDGTKFEEFENGITFEELSAILPISSLRSLPEATMGVIAGSPLGN